MFLQSIKDSPSAISIVSTDLEGNVLFWNKGAENLLGYTAEEMVGKTKIGVLYPDDDETRKTILQVVRFILDNREGTTCEVQEITKDGRRLWVRLTLSPRFNEATEVIGILGIGENITEKRIAEVALAERVRLAAMAAQVGSTLASNDSLSIMTGECAQSILNHTESAFTRIWSLHSGDKNFELLASAESGEFPEISRDPLPGENMAILQTANRRNPILDNNPGEELSGEVADWFARHGISAFAAYPLIVETRMIGAITVFSRNRISDAAQYALTALANEIALGIERLWAYSALRASEERLRAILTNAFEGIVTARQNGIIDSFNPAAEAIFGHSAEQAVGQNISILLAESKSLDIDHVLIPTQENMNEGKRGSVLELVGKKRDGSTFAMEMAVSGLQMPERRKGARARPGRPPILGIFVIRDITERKRFETALKAERDYSASIIEKTPSLICGLSAGGTIRFANPGMEKALGYSGKELIGKNWWRIFFPGERFAAISDLVPRLAEFPLLDRELEMTTRWGALRTISWTTAHRLDTASRVAEVLAFGTDITDRKKAEIELIHAAQRAEESNRLKSEFISTVSHELRTPLNVMLGNTPLLTRREKLPSPEDIVDIAGDIDSSGKHLLALIDDLLDFAKIEARKMTLKLEPVSVRDLVNNVVASVDIMAGQKNLALESDIEDLCLTCDEFRMKQILLNLIGNSIKFTDQGSVRVEANRNGDWVRFRVIDTGCGIAEKDIAYIFDVFRQVDSAFTRAASGSGLGLAITKNLVELHGGKIFAESRLGAGTTITFLIPATLRPSRKETGSTAH